MIVKGIAEWASLHEPNTKYEPVYSIDLLIDDEEKAKIEEACAEFGKKYKSPTIKKAENDLWRIKFKQKFNRADGTEAPPIPVVDAAKQPLDKSILVGNGSQVKVLVRVTDVDNSFGKFVGFYLQKVQVLELVEYQGEDFEDESGGATEGDGTSEEDF